MIERILAETQLDSDYKSDIYELLRNTVSHRHQSVCQICHEPLDEGVPFQQCQPNQLHLAHDTCLAREMAHLKIVNLVCQVCNLQTSITIHDTEQLKDDDECPEFLESARQHNLLDQAIDQDDFWIFN